MEEALFVSCIYTHIQGLKHARTEIRGQNIYWSLISLLLHHESSKVQFWASMQAYTAAQLNYLQCYLQRYDDCLVILEELLWLVLGTRLSCKSEAICFRLLFNHIKFKQLWQQLCKLWRYPAASRHPSTCYARSILRRKPSQCKLKQVDQAGS